MNTYISKFSRQEIEDNINDLKNNITGEVHINNNFTYPFCFNLSGIILANRIDNDSAINPLHCHVDLKTSYDLDISPEFDVIDKDDLILNKLQRIKLSTFFDDIVFEKGSNIKYLDKANNTIINIWISKPINNIILVYIDDEFYLFPTNLNLMYDLFNSSTYPLNYLTTIYLWFFANYWNNNKIKFISNTVNLPILTQTILSTNGNIGWSNLSTFKVDYTLNFEPIEINGTVYKSLNIRIVGTTLQVSMQ